MARWLYLGTVAHKRLGHATHGFRSLWRKAFPNRRAIPSDAIAQKDGQMTEAMLGIWLD